MNRTDSRRWMSLVLVSMAFACVEPKDARPGLWLSGDTASVPADWSFTDAHPEIALEVRPPHLIPHSVTIWCVSVDGDLFVAARSPEEKRWPAWSDRRPDVRLGIEGSIYEVTLEALNDEERIREVRTAYVEKYALPDPPPADAPPMRYWAVRPRS